MGLFSAYQAPRSGETGSLLEIIENQNLSAKEMIQLMVETGNALNNLHESGFLHRDFNLDKVIYDRKENNILLLGMEHALPLAEGQISVGEFMTTPGHFHPEWWMNSRKQYLQNGVVVYTPKNDVYAYLHSAEQWLSLALEKVDDHHYHQRLLETKKRLSDWKSKAFDHLPCLGEVIHCLSRLTRDQPMILSDKMAGLSLHRKKINSDR